MTNKVIPFFKSLINSYGQVLFTNNKYASLFILIATFFDPQTGFSGLLALIVAQLFAFILDLPKHLTHSGLFGFNALLVGLGLGNFYQFSNWFPFWIIGSAFLCLIVSVWVYNLFSQKGLPFLSLPFLITFWIVELAANKNIYLLPNTDSIYLLNRLFDAGGQTLLNSVYTFKYHFPELVSGFISDLGSLFFQRNILAGIPLAIALIISSRISFLLAVIGYSFGYIISTALGVEHLFFTTGIGFNFILISIALGGFFVVPDKVALFTLPFIALITSFLGFGLISFFQKLDLMVYSLPFTVVVWMILVMYRYTKIKGLNLVTIQQYSPEKHLFDFQNYITRFSNVMPIPVSLPIWGEWFVSQAHDGNITHKGDWKEAWDFVLIDNEKRTYKLPGASVEDYYCYNKPVVSPADGYIENIIDGITDNAIGDTDLNKNWGNSIIIKHAFGLYTQLSHIKSGSYYNYIGDYVRAGQIIATCGSSGRSPEPHLHFQVQTTPHLGSKTISYSLSNYLIKLSNNQFKYVASGIPKMGELVSRLQTNLMLSTTFSFEVGTKISSKFSINSQKTEEFTWFVLANENDKKYIWCEKTDSFAWFEKSDCVTFFTSFTGDKNGPLYLLFLSLYRVIHGYYSQINIVDDISRSYLPYSTQNWIKEFIAPILKLKGLKYSSTHFEIDSELKTTKVIKFIRIGVLGRQPILSTEMIVGVNKISFPKINFKKNQYALVCDIY